MKRLLLLPLLLLLPPHVACRDGSLNGPADAGTSGELLVADGSAADATGRSDGVAPTDLGRTDGPAPPDAGAGDGEVEPNSVAQIIADMKDASEAVPSGPPFQAALDHPRPNGNVTRAMVWAMVQHVQGGSPSSNTRVEVRDLRVYVLKYSTGTWELLAQSDLVGSGGTVEGAENPVNYGAGCPAGCATGSDGVTCDCPILHTRVEPGGQSVSTKVPADRYYQPWANVSPIAPGDVNAVFVTMQARLIVDDPGHPDDRATAKFVAAVGLDWYAGSSFVSGAFVGRRKLIGAKWRSINALPLQVTFYDNGQAASALAETELAANPPPLD